MGDRAQLCIQGEKRVGKGMYGAIFQVQTNIQAAKPLLSACALLWLFGKQEGQTHQESPAQGRGAQLGFCTLIPAAPLSPGRGFGLALVQDGPGDTPGSVPVAFPCPRLLPEGEELFTLCQVGHCSPGSQPAAFPAGALMTFLVPVTRWGPGPRPCSIHRSIHRCQLGNQSRLSRGDTAPRPA